MDRNQFRLFLKRYVEHKCTPEEVALVDQWYELIGDEDMLSAMEESDWQYTEEQLWQKISAQTVQPAGLSVRSRVRPLHWAIAAAVAGILIAVTLFFHGETEMLGDQLYAAVDGHYKETINNTSSPYNINLEDGTVIRLYPGAAMKYPQHFNAARREVYLKGKAFFDIGKDAGRPFYVYSTHLVTHVLGTSFTITPATDGKQVEVSVRSGRVEVYEQQKVNNEKINASSGVILTPNQRVIYRKAESSFETALVESPEPVIPKEELGQAAAGLVFNDDSLRMVVNSLENYYGVEIVVENSNLYNCPFTGGLIQPDLYTKLDVLCQSVGASYEIKGTRILIRGKGCN
jgi:ferric-dicitrate binding protein FerR (iron transport regulator)